MDLFSRCVLHSPVWQCLVEHLSILDIRSVGCASVVLRESVRNEFEHRNRMFYFNISKCFDDVDHFVSLLKSTSSLLVGSNIMTYLSGVIFPSLEDVEICISRRFLSRWVRFLRDRNCYGMQLESSSFMYRGFEVSFVLFSFLIF